MSRAQSELEWGADGPGPCSIPGERDGEHIGRIESQPAAFLEGFPLFARIIALSSLLLVAGCGPFLLIPGGKLDGSTAPAPSDWSFAAEVGTIQLETRPEDPYSVNIWAVGIGPVLYVHAGANRANWVEHMEANANVRVRIEATLYELRSSRVEDQAEFNSFSDAYEEKYGSRPRNENVQEAYLFRLEARTD